VRAEVVHPGDLGPEERQLWDLYTLDSSLGSPFLSWEFTQAIGTVRDDCRVAVLDDGGGTCGFLAFELGSDGAGRPAGATICDAQAVVGPPDWVFDPRRLVAAAGLTRWAFDHLNTEQAPFAPYHRQRYRSPFIDLRGGHEQFLSQLRAHSKDLLAQVGRRRRKLEREVGPVVLEWQSSQPDGDMQRLRSWKSEQYARGGEWDRFSHRWIADALTSLMISRNPGCTGVLTALRAGDRLVAAHLGLLGKDRLSWWFPAYDPDLGRYSPGLILLLDLINEASSRGVPLVDLGRGEHGYKLRFTSQFYEVAAGEVPAARA
jgi:CelD/BcsL family acetyltransferase involved in cellulose biosynthesis